MDNIASLLIVHFVQFFQEKSEISILRGGCRNRNWKLEMTVNWPDGPVSQFSPDENKSVWLDICNDST